MSNVEPTPGPRWTRKRLLQMLIDCYGPSTRGALDVNAVADYAGVTPTTVRRWIQPTGHRKPHIPKARIAQLQRGTDLIERRNEQQYRYALNAIANVSDGQILPAWTRQQWLDQHHVMIVEIRGKPWHQVITTKGDRRALTALKRRATVLESAALPTWFHAEVLAYQVMRRQQNWRVHPARSQLATGRTRVWMADAPLVELAALSQI